MMEKWNYGKKEGLTTKSTKDSKGEEGGFDSRRERKATQRGKNNGGRTFLSAIKILIERLGELHRRAGARELGIRNGERE